MSSLKVLKSSMIYGSYAEGFYASRPGLAGQVYSAQMEALLADGFSFGDAWKHYLEATGRYEVMEVVMNAKAAQQQWAMERGRRFSDQDWQYKVLAAQMAEFKPDVWFCHGALPAEQRSALRKTCPTIRYVIGYDGVLNHDPSRFAGCDMIIAPVRETVQFYNNAGIHGYLMRWGFDPRVAGRLFIGPPRYDATFCGSTFMTKGIHLGRVELLHFLSKNFEIANFTPILERRVLLRQFLSLLRHGDFGVAGRVLRHYTAWWHLSSISRGERYGLAMFRLLAESKVVLNFHIDATKGAGNIRMFEATGVGSCLLTDWKENLPALFEPDQEVVAFRSHEECAAKLRYLLDNDDERRSIAAAGQKRCLRDHNIGNHILSFADNVLNRL